MGGKGCLVSYCGEFEELNSVFTQRKSSRIRKYSNQRTGTVWSENENSLRVHYSQCIDSVPQQAPVRKLSLSSKKRCIRFSVPCTDPVYMLDAQDCPFAYSEKDECPSFCIHQIEPYRGNPLDEDIFEADVNEELS